MKSILFSIILTAFALPNLAQSAIRESVIATARNVNEYFMNKYSDPTEATFVKKQRPSSLWTRAVYYEGLLALYAIDPDNRYIEYTDKWASFHKWTPRNGIETRDADDQCCCQIYLSRFLMTGDSVMMQPTLNNLQGQMAEHRVDYWTWIDAIQMAMPVYAMMYKISKENAFLNKAMEYYRWSRDECGGGLFNKEDGLWWRDADYVPPYKEKDGAQCYWSRGNGWVIAALLRVMDCIDKGSAEYKELLNNYLLMCKGIVERQRSDGFWNVSLSSPSTYGGPETTGTSLFLYGICRGMNLGLLNKKEYRPIVDKAWEALSTRAVHPDGFLGYVQGTGKDPSAGQPVTYNKSPDFDDYGVGCFLLGASEYYKLLEQ